MKSLAPNAGSKGRPSVVIVAGDVAWNCGDLAVRAAIVASLRRACPETYILTYSKRPEEEKRLLAVDESVGTLPALLWRVRHLPHLKAIIWGGGHLLQDNSSALKCPYWAFLLTALRRVARCPIMGFGAGFGPLTSRLGRYASSLALRQLAGIIVRDETSARLARELGPAGLPIHTAPDPAVALEPADRADAVHLLREVAQVRTDPHRILIGIAPRRWFHVRQNILPLQLWHGMGIRRSQPVPLFQQAMQQFVDALNRLAERVPAHFLLFPFYPAPWEGDDRLCHDLAARLRAPSHVLRTDCAPARLKALTGLCDLFVSVRMHSALLAMGCGVPTVCIAYTNKVVDFAEALGVRERVLDINALATSDGADLLFARLLDIAEHRSAIAADLGNRWRRYAAGCRLYDETAKDLLFAPAPRRSY